MTAPWNAIVAIAATAQDVVLAAPYIKEDALRRVLEVTPRMTSLVCVTRWSASDLAIGVSDITTRELVIGRDGTFRLHPTLHAKYFRFDNKSLVGSANLTNPGLGLGDKSNLEILTRPSDAFDSSEFERSLLVNSRIVSDAEFAMWNSVARMPQPPGTVAEPWISNWRPITRDPNDVWAVYSGEIVPEFPESVRQRARSDLSAIRVPLGLNRGDFAAWVHVALLASPFVLDVQSISRDEKPIAYIGLGESWDMTPVDARYAAETVTNWLSYCQVTFERTHVSPGNAESWI